MQVVGELVYSESEFDMEGIEEIIGENLPDDLFTGGYFEVEWYYYTDEYGEYVMGDKNQRLHIMDTVFESVPLEDGILEITMVSNEVSAGRGNEWVKEYSQDMSEDEMIARLSDFVQDSLQNVDETALLTEAGYYE